MSFLLTLVALFLSVAAGIVPTAIYVLLIWWIDRYEKEPLKLLVAAFLWGALPAVFVAAILENLFDIPLGALSRQYSGLVSASFIAPPVEEVLKGLALLGLFWLVRREFDDVLDGVIYGSIVGFGFAMTENIFYFFNAWAKGGWGSWSFVVMARALAFGLNHAMFTSFTGVGLGMARFEKSGGRRLLFILLGLTMATGAHFMHNFFLSAANACVLSFIVDWLGVFAVLVIVLLGLRRERLWMKVELADEVANGVLTQLQYETVVSRRSLLKHGWQLLGISGLSQVRLWRRLVVAATELAFKRYQQKSMGDEHGNGKTIAALRTSILHIRQQLGDPLVLESTPCPHCGRPLDKAQAQVCPQCGMALPGTSVVDKELS
jgi:protease PrsW